MLKHFLPTFFLLILSINASLAKEPNISIGAREVPSTAKEKGDLYASPKGKGLACTLSKPCTIQTALTKLQAGFVLFLRGGVYNIEKELTLPSHVTGTKKQPIVIESYPNERAIIDGGCKTINDVKTKKNQDGLHLDGSFNYIKIRKLTIRNIARSGIRIRGGNYNTIEGCSIYNCHYMGIFVDTKEGYRSNPMKPYTNTLGNIIQDNKIYNNSDAFLSMPPFDNGGNSDGVSIKRGRETKVLHNTIYQNSDDGIDVRLAQYTTVAYNRVYSNGIEKGNGNGIKAGGHPDGSPKMTHHTRVEHNLVYFNKKRGIQVNNGREDIIRYNTAYRNAKVDFQIEYDTQISHNIASAYNTIEYNGKKPPQSIYYNNSWQLSHKAPKFITTNPKKNNFLKPVIGSMFEELGVYVK